MDFSKSEKKSLNYNFQESVHQIGESIDALSESISKSKIPTEKTEGGFCFECDSLKLKPDLIASLVSMADELYSIALTKEQKAVGDTDLGLFVRMKRSCDKRRKEFLIEEDSLEASKPITYNKLLQDKPLIFVSFCLEW